MKKAANKALIAFIGIVLFSISLYLDIPVSLFFKNLNFYIFDFILIIITNFSFVGFVILLLPSIILYKEPKKMRLFWISFVFSVVLSFLIKIIVLRQRPEATLAYPMMLGLEYSFPSLHAMVVFAALPLLTKIIPKYKNFWISFALLVAFTRIYFGFHFLSDVIFGGFLGYIIGSFILDWHESGKS